MAVVSLEKHQVNRKQSVPSLTKPASLHYLHHEKSLLGKNVSFRQSLDESSQIICSLMKSLSISHKQRIELSVVDGKAIIQDTFQGARQLEIQINNHSSVKECLKRAKSTLAVRIFTLEAMHYAAMVMKNREQARDRYAHLNGDTQAIRVSLIYANGQLIPRVVTPIRTYW